MNIKKKFKEWIFKPVILLKPLNGKYLIAYNNMYPEKNIIHRILNYIRIKNIQIQWDYKPYPIYIYYKNNKIHREDGPAVESQNGSKEWHIEGKLHSKQISDNCGGYVKYYLKDEEGHREDGPAIESSDGTKIWLNNGLLHREDVAAKEWANGDKEWWLNGKLHREDGPAIDMPIKYNTIKQSNFCYGKIYHVEDKGFAGIVNFNEEGKSWFINGIEYQEKEFNEKIIS